MGIRGKIQKSVKYRVALAMALFSVSVVSAMTAEALPPPSQPYTVTRWVDGWAYNAGETLNVTMRITANTLDLADMLFMNINEGFSPSSDAWEFVALNDPSERVTCEPPVQGVHNTLNFSVKAVSINKLYNPSFGRMT